jgi:3'-5' exoribonuclease
MKTSADEIAKIGEELRITSSLYENLLKDGAFITFPASIDLHHSYTGGLVAHTLEVIRIGLSTIKTLDLRDFNTTVFFLAALYHDSGKMWDYEEGISGIWAKTRHNRTIHHISRSAIFWNEIAFGNNLHEEVSCKVTHCILSHHGQRAWGSPVAPSSKESWLLHCSDMVSARLNDCDKIDILKAKPE